MTYNYNSQSVSQVSPWLDSNWLMWLWLAWCRIDSVKIKIMIIEIKQKYILFFQIFSILISRQPAFFTALYFFYLTTRTFSTFSYYLILLSKKYDWLFIQNLVFGHHSLQSFISVDACTIFLDSIIYPLKTRMIIRYCILYTSSFIKQTSDWENPCLQVVGHQFRDLDEMV